MIIKRHTTGFDCKEVNTFSANEFKKSCFQIGRDNGVQVVSVDTNLLGKNFYCATFEEKNGATIYLLFNPHTLYLCFANKVNYEGIDYLNCSWNLSNVPMDYTLLSMQDLTESIDGSLGELALEEIQQIEYWKPGKCGDVIYNYWD